ncbi:MAG: hypothetical protein ACI94Y_002494 [Maribacter sp.]|jgi:hypothetical protein
MKHIINIILAMSIVVTGFAQTTITNTSFIAEGDILYSSMDNLPNVDLGTPGENTWDYSGLSSPQIDALEVYPASTGIGADDFPSADVYINFLGGELYLKINTNDVTQIGYIGEMMGFDVNTALNPQGIYSKAPINYQDSYSDENGIGFTIPADQIPFLDALNLPINPDSIRITQVFNTSYEADAWGTMTIPSGNIYDVLRIKKIQTTDTQIEAFVPFINWIDVTDLVGNDGAFGGLGGGTVESYDFLADGIKEAIATVRMDTVGGNIVRVTYKAEGSGSTPVAEVGENNDLFVAYPNPAYGDVKIDIRGFENGEYDLKVFNIGGKEVMKKHLNINRDTAVTINVAHLDKGTYFYALIDEDGKILRARRLMVIKP